MKVSKMFLRFIALGLVTVFIAGCANTVEERKREYDTESKPLAQTLTREAQFDFALDMVKLQIEREDYEGAEELLTKLRREQGDDIRIYRLLSQVYEKQENPKLSFISYQKIIEFDEHTLDDEAEFAGMALQLEEYSQAEAIYRKWTQNESNQVKVAGYNNLGFMYILKEEYGSARANLEEALKIDPLNRKAYSNLELLDSLGGKNIEKFKS